MDFDILFVIAFGVVGTFVALSFVLTAILFVAGAPALLAIFRGIRSGDYGALRLREPPSSAPAELNTAWPDDDVAFVSLADLARQQTQQEHPTAAPAQSPKAHLSADELVLDMLRVLKTDYEHRQQSLVGCDGMASI